MEGRGLGGKEMPSQSSANLLDLIAADSNLPSSSSHPACLPHVMADPCILSIAGVADGDSSPAMPECRIIVSHHLPLRAIPDPAAPFGWSSYDLDALSSNFAPAFPSAPRSSTLRPSAASPMASTLPIMTPSMPTSAASSATSPSSSPLTSMPASTIPSVSTTSSPSSTTSSPSIPRPSMAYILMETLGDATSTKPQSPSPNCPSLPPLLPPSNLKPRI